MNICIQGIGLKPLKGDTKEHCQHGHETKGHFAKGLLESDCPCSMIKEIDNVGLVQKSGKKHVKASIDALVFVKNKAGEQDVLLCEYKERIKTKSAQKE